MKCEAKDIKREGKKEENNLKRKTYKRKRRKKEKKIIVVSLQSAELLLCRYSLQNYCCIVSLQN